MEFMNLHDKTALVTGGGTGIGRAVALALAAAGCRVAIAGRRLDKLQEVVAAGASGTPLIARACDVTDRGSVQDLVVWATAELGRIDILVNGAGANIKTRSMASMRPEQWDEMLAVNATSAYYLIAATLPQMRERQDGLIVNISSVSGKRASTAGGVAYCAAKFALTALGTAVALEEGKNGIRVTNICPGEVDTPILENRPVAVTAEHRARILQPDDIAAAVLMVAQLPPRAHVAEMIIKPTWQDYS